MYSGILAPRGGKMMNKFTKADLRTGYYVETKNGLIYLYIDGYFINESSSISLDDYDDDLLIKNRIRDGLNIIKVCRNDKIDGINPITMAANEVLLERTEEDEGFYQFFHKKMWNDITTGKADSKREWLDKYYPQNMKIPYNGCFACEEAKRKEKEEDISYCACCPITPLKEDLCCGGLFQEYERLREDGNLREARYFAGLIRDLPWDKNMEKDI